MKKEKEIYFSFSASSQMAKVKDTLCDKCLVKMEKALNLYHILREKEKGHTHINFIIVY